MGTSPPETPGTTIAWTPLRQAQPAVRRRHRGWIIAAVLLLLAGLVGYGLFDCWPRPQSGRVIDIAQGDLQIQLGSGAPWTEAKVGQIVSQGSRLRAEPGTIASVELPGQGVLRVESAGEWSMFRLASSRNGRIRRVIIDQQEGQASYASPAPQQLFPPVFRIQVPDAVCSLLGTATLATREDGVTLALVHEGACRISTELDEFELTAGQTLTIRRARAADTAR